MNSDKIYQILFGKCHRINLLKLNAFWTEFVNFLMIIHNSREQTFNFHPNYISVMMCLERLNNGVRCRHNKHLALITESAVPYLATDQNSGHYSQPTVGPNVSKPAKN